MALTDTDDRFMDPHHSSGQNLPARQKLSTAGAIQWFHWVIVLLSLGLTLLAWRYSQNQLRAKIQLQFDRESDGVIQQVIERMAKYEEALLGGVALYASSEDDITHSEWLLYASTLRIEKKYPGINGIGVVYQVPVDEAEAFVNQVNERQSGFEIYPEHEQDELWPITYITPLAVNRKAWGLDLAHETNRYTAIKLARRTGLPSVSGPIVLVQDAQKTPGFLFFSPVYRNRVPAPNVPTTNSSGVGEKESAAESPPNPEDCFAMVYAPFIIKKLMEGTLENKRRRVGIRIRDLGSQNSEGAHQSGVDDNSELFNELQPSDEDFDPDPMFETSVVVPMYGRSWQFDLASSRSFRNSVSSSQPITILLAGLFIDAMLIWLFWMNSRAFRRAYHWAESATEINDRLSLAATSTGIGIWDFNPVSDQLKWDDIMYEIYNVRREGFSGDYSGWLATLHPDEREVTNAVVQAALSNDEDFNHEFKVRLADGTERYIVAGATIFRDEQGKATRMLGFNRDVTQQRKIADALKSSEVLRDAIVDSAGVAIITTDAHGTVTSFNNAAETMLECHVDQVVGKKHLRHFHDPDEIVERLEIGNDVGGESVPFVSRLAECTAAENLREWTYVSAAGKRKSVLVIATPLRQRDDDEVFGYLCVATDVTERKRYLERIEDANEELKRSNEDLAQFAYVASHDLQEPLRVVGMYSEILNEDYGDKFDVEGKKALMRILDGSRRMRSLIQGLLSYSRLDSKSNLSERIDCGDLLEDVKSVLSSAIKDSGAVITHGTLPTIEFDRSWMEQLLQNLIANGIKYCEEAKPQIHVDYAREGEDHVFSVTDNGIGIEEQYHQQIFGIFRRLHNQSQYKGTGIGLAICKRIMERCDGEIWVEAPEGQSGTVFKFRIPG